MGRHKSCITTGRPEVKNENFVDLGIAGTILKWILMEMVPIIILTF